MNTETGRIYNTPETIRAAEVRGEPLVPVSQRIAGLSKKKRMQLGNAIANLKRPKPAPSDEAREELALKMLKLH